MGAVHHTGYQFHGDCVNMDISVTLVEPAQAIALVQTPSVINTSIVEQQDVVTVVLNTPAINAAIDAEAQVFNVNFSSTAIPGPAGPAGETAFIHTQDTPSDLWIINHNLNRVVCALISDLVGNAIVAESNRYSTNQIRISFSVPTTGIAKII